MLLGLNSGQERQLREPHCWEDDVCDAGSNKFQSRITEHQVEANEVPEFHSEVGIERGHHRLKRFTYVFAKQVELAITRDYRSVSIKDDICVVVADVDGSDFLATGSWIFVDEHFGVGTGRVSYHVHHDVTLMSFGSARNLLDKIIHGK